jgi:hypothetical protein
MGFGDKLAAMVSKASINNDRNDQTAKVLGASDQGTTKRQEELAESAATAADVLKEEGY